jgi:hypothetical protein
MELNMEFMPALSPIGLLQLLAKSFHPFRGNYTHIPPLGSYFNFQLAFLKISCKFTSGGDTIKSA